MKRYLFVLAIFGVVQILILQSDYWISLNDYFAIYPAPRNPDAACLGYGHGPGKLSTVMNVKSYVVLPEGSVCGETTDAQWFLVSMDGEVSLFDKKDELVKASSEQSGYTPSRFFAVSRFDDPFVARLQLGACVLVFAAFAVMFGVGRISGVRE